MSDDKDLESNADEYIDWPSQSRPISRDGGPPIAPPGAPPDDSASWDSGGNSGYSESEFRVPVQVVVGRTRMLTLDLIAMLDVGYTIGLEENEDDPLEIVYKGRKVGEAIAEEVSRDGHFSVKIDKTIGVTKVGYLHFVVKEKVETAQITRFRSKTEFIVRIHIQRKKKQILLKNTDNVEITAELGRAEIPFLELLNFRRDRTPLIQLDNMMKSRWPFAEPVRIKIFGQTVFLGKLTQDLNAPIMFKRKPRRLIQITEVLI